MNKELRTSPRSTRCSGRATRPSSSCSFRSPTGRRRRSPSPTRLEPGCRTPSTIRTLEAQLASLKAQTAGGFGNEDEFRDRPGDSFLRPWGSDAAMNPQLMPYHHDAVLSSQRCHHHHSSYTTDDSSMASFLDVQDDAWRPACHDMEELLQSVAFGHLNCA
ncbi:hypothetical protein BHM03_00022726 [Ensete ventricosum]|nr:hypothetical protein BHM03_00022726 [Ensete ventricosum]